MADPRIPQALRFGDFVLDVSAYELRRRGRPVRIERLPMELLILLVDRRHELVTRSEIVERLWGGDVFLEVDASVNTLVRKIRRVLGDAVDQPQFIQTVQGKGYRFVATVEVVSPRQGPPDLRSESTRSPLERPGSPLDPVAPALPSLDPAVQPLPARWSLPSRARVVVGFLAIALVVLVGRLTWSRLDAGADVSPVRVAVMPFENLSGDLEREYLADGLTEETAASLGQIIDPRRVIVIGRMSTKGYKHSGKSVAEIARLLGAEYLIVGSVQVENHRVRITSNLLRVRDQVQVWSGSYDREPVSMLAMQQELGTAVAQQVRLRLLPERLDELAQRQTQNADAYDLYLKGRYFGNQLTPAMTTRALEAYRRATALDHNYALAWSGIADAYTQATISGDAQPLALRDRARDAAERAMKSRAMLAETQTSAGMQQFFLEWDWRRAEAALRQAIQIDPNYAMAHRLLGVVLSHGNRPGEAKTEMHRARQLEPEYVMNHALSAMAEFHAGDFEAAIIHARHAIAIDAEFWIAHYHLAQAYEQLGWTDLALEELASAARLSNSNSKTLSVRGYALAKAGRRSEAQDVLDTFEQLSATRYVPPYARALVHAGFGDRDATFEWLEKALAERDVHLIFLPVDPKWSPLRTDPRFQDLLDRCGFPPSTKPARAE